jgi:cell wall-associated NlpC family hydrolase
VCKIHGFALPRDSSRQAESGTEVSDLKNSLPGDLAFFGNDRGIDHVGIILSPQEIIHCSGWVKTDRLGPAGIINRATGILTHHLKGLRRLT